MDGFEPLRTRRRGRGRATAVLAAILLAVAIFATVANFYISSEKEMPGPLALFDAPAPSATVAAPVPVVEEPGIASPPEEVSLEGTDEVVRGLAVSLSSHPGLAKWLATDDLIRRFVVAVVNVAEGASPRKPLAFLEPEENFRVVEKSGRPFVDPESYHRYDAVAEIVASLDAEGCARLHRSLETHLEAAFHELGYPGRDFDEMLAKAIERLLEVPIVEGEIALDPRVATHEFANPDLEQLTPAQKHLLRAGPMNVVKIQAKLRDIEHALVSAPAPTAVSSPTAGPAIAG